YDQPKGAKITLGLLRLPARDPKHRIGSLFVNPGGPGGMATRFALSARHFLSGGVLDRFDIVGLDPRGVGKSTQLQCFSTTAQRDRALAPLDDLAFPYGPTEEASYVGAAKALGRACSTTVRSLTGAMSTSEDARDLDVMRRAVGDRKLSYFGLSYGSALGQYYADLFPDRVRVVAIDGVINPLTWAGTTATRETVQDDRLRSADGAYAALRELLKRCAAAGAARCTLAADGDPTANFDVLAQRLRVTPASLPDPVDGTTTVTYADFISYVLGNLYDDNGYGNVVAMTKRLLEATAPAAAGTPADRDAAGRAVAALLARAKADARGSYNSSFEMYSAVSCTDGQHPADASLWPAKLAAADVRAPYFGRAWGYSTVACGRSTWTVRDEDAYTGPWTKRTSGPVLVVGNYWDPATNYAEAVAVSKELPNSRLLSSDSWGHTAYGRGTCVTGAVDRFLLTAALPAKGTVCKGDVQPFAARVAAARVGGSPDVDGTEPPLPNPWLAALARR
ncbi:MAG TPA: alpha/beta hydrolase, partial [Kineosporiaceae bacterium]|nr:alpha/beta hydrolase [Kineosporiaceae bacterium]